MSEVEIVSTSPAVLAADGEYERRPRAPWRKRGEAFDAGFDRRTLFYDCFRAADGETVLLIGPPLRNLRKAVERADFHVAGSGRRLAPRVHASLSVTIVALSGVPADAFALTVALGDQSFSLAIQPNYAQRLARRRLLFTISRNNAPEWISAWAQYHRRFHGVDAVVLFDNGSTNLTPEGVGAALGKSGIPEVFVVPWNHPFGPFDPKVVFDPYWARFAQISAMSLTLRRFGAAAAGLLNCDIDELVHTRAAGDIFDALDRTPQGLLVMHGAWVETRRVRDGFGDHRDFGYRLKDPKARHCAQRKWVLDPRRSWVADLDVHPYWHWIKGRPRGAKSMSPDIFYWHFKGINTNWKTARNVAGTDDSAIEIDPELAEVLERWRSDFA